MSKILPIIFGLLLINGCQSHAYRESNYQKMLSGWLGKSADSLYSAWGYPMQTTPIDAQRYMVTYYQSEDQPIDNVFEPYEGEIAYDDLSTSEYGLPSAPPLFYCQTSFVIRNNIVVDFNFNGDDCYVSQ